MDSGESYITYALLSPELESDSNNLAGSLYFYSSCFFFSATCLAFSLACLSSSSLCLLFYYFLFLFSSFMRSYSSLSFLSSSALRSSSELSRVRRWVILPARGFYVILSMYFFVHCISLFKNIIEILNYFSRFFNH